MKSFALGVALALVASFAPLAPFVPFAPFARSAHAAGTTQSFTFHAQSYAGSRDRQYKVYVPSGLASPAPMVMALHGCEQTNDDVLNDWGLKAASDRFGFLLVAPFITSYDGLRNTNCWGFWLDQHRHQGRGEVEDLHRIAMEVEGRFAVDPARRYITGLSSGGAMTIVAAVAHNEYWAAAASAAGLPYGEDAASVSLSQQCPGSATFHAIPRIAADMRAEIDNNYPIPLLVLQSDNDCVVVQPAGNNLRDAQLQVFGDAAHNTPGTARSAQHGCTPAFQSDFGCRQTVYTGDGSARSLVETVFYNGPAATPNTADRNVGHYWIGGEHGNEGRYAMRQGPSYPDIVWDFFARHARGATPPPPPPSTSCVKASASPLAHIGASRAVRGGFFNLRALATGNGADIGFGWDSWSRVTLYEAAPGKWFPSPQAGCPA